MVVIKPSVIDTPIFSHGTAPLNHAKHLIQKHPGIYEGNLIHRLQEEIGSLAPREINHIFFQLITSNYEFKRGLIYPPNTLDPIYNQIKRFTLNEGLDEMDFEILIVTSELKEKATLRSISRRVVSQNSDYSENEIVYRIGLLFKNNVLRATPSEKDMEYLELNWAIIRRE
jgi:hypothetical protein